MVSSNEIEATIGFFLVTIHSANPSVIVIIMMAEFIWAQINPIRKYYPEALIYLCWWHVLDAWQQHITILHNLEAD